MYGIWIQSHDSPHPHQSEISKDLTLSKYLNHTLFKHLWHCFI